MSELKQTSEEPKDEINSKESKQNKVESFINLVILVSIVIIFLQESGVNTPIVKLIDATCTVIFIIEMIVKQCKQGFTGYWKDKLNRFDGILVLVSIPSLITYFIPASNLDFSVLLVLRLFRILRVSRMIHLKIFRNFKTIMESFKKALSDSAPIFIGFAILILALSLISCALFKDISEYFSTPLESIYSIFRMCTTEGWYDIPDSISAGMSPGWAVVVRIYFITILIAGGILGLSLVNSIFVDAMLSNKNKGISDQVAELNKKIEELTKKLDEKNN